MRINLNKEEEKEVIILLETKEENIAIASMLNELCFSLDQFEKLKSLNNESTNAINKTCKDLFYDYFELDKENEDNARIVESYLSNAFKYEDAKKYNQNLYKNSLKIKNITQNSYKIHYLEYPKYSFFPLDDITVDEAGYYKEYTSLGFFNDNYQYLTLSKNNNIWMCITPNEINTMRAHIEEAYGNVVTFGLGLGYFAYMAAHKKEVKKVTIVEKDINVINLFTHYILPYFDCREKIEIVEDDAFNFIKQNGLQDYDYAFFDLWHNAEDGLPLYIRVREMKLSIKTGYWIEESLIAMYRRCLLTVIEESLAHYSDDDYRKNKNAMDKIINQIYFKTKNLTLNSYQEIHQLLSKDSIIKLIEK